MPDRKRAAVLLKTIPDSKMGFVVSLPKNLKGYAGEAIEPDEWDLEMIERAEKENDGTTMTLEEISEELGMEV